MSVDYNTAILNARLNVVLTAIDAGATNGWLRLLDISDNVLSSFQLSRPMGAVLGRVLTFNGLSLIDPSAVAAGIAQRARVEDGNGTIIISGLTVAGGAPADIVMTPTTTIAVGQTIAITAATITGN